MSAVDDGLIPKNPAARWGRIAPQGLTEVEEIDVFTPDELTVLLTEAQSSAADQYPMLLHPGQNRNAPW
jgi:hypothetical protein